MRLYFTLMLLILLHPNLFGQTLEQKDSLINIMCNVILETKGQPDTLRVLTAYENHLYPFLSKFTQDKREEIGMSIYIRFQRNCTEFKKIIDNLNPSRGDWQTVAEKPISNLTKQLCKNFLNHKHYKYLESSGDTVRLTIENGYWVDNFKDGTYSKLSLKWVNDCEFDIEFIESNNYGRMNFSKPGDKYRYQILSEKENYYDMSVEIVGTRTYLVFKIYY